MKRAFTLTEMLVVLAVISILIGTMNVHVQHKKLQAEAKNIVECVKIYEAALSSYYLRNLGNFPEDTNGKKLEDVNKLKPYCPTGFNTDGSIYTEKYQSMQIFDTNNFTNYGIQLIINGDESLADEIVSQLNEFAVASQITHDKEEGTSTIKYHLKKGNDIYI
ncbi:MAG: type II secretion system protein [bacterium]